MASTYRQVINLLERALPRCLFLWLYAMNARCRVKWILWCRYGFSRSAREWASVDRDGRPIPWFTYPAIEYLDQLDLSKKKVFEYGCGNSTLYWAGRAQSVVSVESNPQWKQKIGALLPGNGRVILAERPEEYAGCIQKEPGAFDIIVIDGFHRLDCAKAAINKLAPDGVVILDDSEENTDAAAFLRQQDLIEADFAGFKPVHSATKTTSFFLRPSFRPNYKDSNAPGPSLGSAGCCG